MPTRFITLFSLIVALAATPATAQPANQSWAPPAPVVREAMTKLDWLKGEWRGEGWRNTPEGHENFATHERVESEVDGLVLLLHGRGWALHEDGTKDDAAEHIALGVLSYDAYRKSYIFDSYVKEGYQTRGTPSVGDNEFRWSHPAGPGAEMRYHARLNDAGEWFETGERCVENVCTPFLEMRLKKIESD